MGVSPRTTGWIQITQGPLEDGPRKKHFATKIEPSQVILRLVAARLKQTDAITLRVGPNEVSTASMTRLVKNHRKWVAKILILLLVPGMC